MKIQSQTQNLCDYWNIPKSTHIWAGENQRRMSVRTLQTFMKAVVKRNLDKELTPNWKYQ